MLFSGVENSWIVHNNEGVVTLINKVKNTKGASSVSTFGFSTQHTTNIPHDQLKCLIKENIDFSFKIIRQPSENQVKEM